jgi:DNA-binding Lrp family transcriptional regulator
MFTRKRLVRAYVLITVRAGHSKKVAEALVQMAGVKQAHACWGVPDVIAFVEVSSQRELDELVMEKVQRLEGVDRTDTHIALSD